jgi:hypothetical protein
MTTVYGLDPPVNELFSDKSGASTIVRSWIRDDGAVQPVDAPPYHYIYTFPLNFDGLKTRKQIEMVNIHVSAGVGANWTCYASVNEGSGVTSTFGVYPDILESIYAFGAVPIDSSNAADLVVMTAAFNTNNAALVGYRFILGLQTSCMVAPTEVYAIDIGYQDWQEPGEGDP